MLKQKLDCIFVIPFESFLKRGSAVFSARPVHVRSTFYQELCKSVLFVPYGCRKRASKPQILLSQIV